MFAVDRLILVGAILLLIGIASSKISSRVGLPVLVIFLLIGMLAGSEAIGGIEFENYTLAHGIATIGLAIILFDGGLRTSLDAVRTALAPSLTLATAGVLLTALITGVAASVILRVPLIEGMVLGSIVGSTDAAAVFSVLRSKGLNLPERLSATLEVESGSNDPMAVFLTVGLLGILLGRMDPGPELAGFFLLQMGVGAAAGLAVGKGTAWAVNRVNLDAAGLYPVLIAGAGLLSYGLAAAIGGSGFLSVYLAGIVIGNSRIVFQRSTLLFHDGAAWLAQITMFVLLGLLSFPSRLADVATQGLLIAAVLIFVARPVAVFALLLPFRYSVREIAFISWVGLKGAVPIVLATYPLLFGLADGELLFDITFFVVLVSAVLQGWTLPPLARILGLQVPARPEPPVSLEITSLRDVEGDIVEYTVTGRCRAAGRALRDLALPDGAVVAMIARDQRIIPPRGSTRILPGDHIFMVLRPDVRPLVDRVFSREPGEREEPPVPPRTEFPLRGDTTVAELAEFYGIRLETTAAQTLDELLRSRLGDRIETGSGITIDGITIVAREVIDGRVDRVGLAVRKPTGAQEPEPAAESEPRPK